MARDGRNAGRVVTIALALLVCTQARAAHAQGSGPRLVMPNPGGAAMRVAADSFTGALGQTGRIDIYRDPAVSGPRPVVLFANASGTQARTMAGYNDWARLVATRGFIGVLYDGPGFDPARAPAEYRRIVVAQMDSVMAALNRRADRHGIEIGNLVVWAGSAQTGAGTPFSLEGNRAVRGYVLYYGLGTVGEPRLDVPVFIVRAGLDNSQLNAAIDSLALRLVNTGVPVTLVTHPAGAHGFDVIDNDAMSIGIIEQTLDFIALVTSPAHRAAVAAGVPVSRASAAFNARRWADAERLYHELTQQQPANRIIAWRLGLAQLANTNAAAALVTFDRARALGQGGARDIGLPATRAALRSGNTARAVEWLKWALTSFPAIRNEVAADTELAPLLEHPEIRAR
ncbi:MAG: alpha/beta hydrolase [Longimicrobiales bacterium]